MFRIRDVQIYIPTGRNDILTLQENMPMNGIAETPTRAERYAHWVVRRRWMVLIV